MLRTTDKDDRIFKYNPAISQNELFQSLNYERRPEMRKRLYITLGILIITVVVWLSTFFLFHRKNTVKFSPKARARKLSCTVEKADSWLRSQQNEKGAYGEIVGLTSLATIALQGSSSEREAIQIKRGLEYIARSAKSDGSISGRNLPNYNTALSIIALEKSGNSAYDEAIRRGREFLVRLQCDRGEGYSSEHWFYGGIGYGGDQRPDLSNTFLALDALKATDLSEHSKSWKKALNFLERCQNYDTNDQSWAGGDGGFIYYPGKSQAGGTKSYGSMTYSGLLSYTYCGLEKDDPRVQAAVNWIREHYTVQENPNMGKQGLYYYYFVMAKSLAVYGEKIFVDNKGVSHYWADELTDKLIHLQHRGGYWVNENNRWMEDNKALVTAYALVALEHCRPFLTLKD